MVACCPEHKSATANSFGAILLPRAGSRSLKAVVMSATVEFGFLAGLGFLWPYLAGYPQNKIAIVDLACVMKPFSQDVRNMKDTNVMVRLSM